MINRSSPASFAIAAAMALVAIFLFDVMGAIIKHLGQRYPAPQLAMFRNVFSLLPTLLILLWSRSWIEAGRPIVIRQWRFALARSGFGVMAQLCFFVALFNLELATATTLTFAGPLFVTALSIPVLGAHVGPARWIAVTIGFAGVLLVMQPAADSFTWYAVLPLCAAFCYASISVTAKLFDHDVPTALINLYYNAGTLVGSTLLVVVTGLFVPVASLIDWAWLVAMGVAGGSAAFLIISAYRLAEAASLSPFEYFAIPFSFVIGWIFFAEAPFDRLIPGVFLIVGGGLAIAWRERALARARAGDRAQTPTA